MQRCCLQCYTPKIYLRVFWTEFKCFIISNFYVFIWIFIFLNIWKEKAIIVLYIYIFILFFSEIRLEISFLLNFIVLWMTEFWMTLCEICHKSNIFPSDIFTNDFASVQLWNQRAHQCLDEHFQQSRANIFTSDSTNMFTSG